MNVLITRAADQAEASAEIFSMHGLTAYCLPMTEYKHCDRPGFMLDKYDFCVLTSPFSAKLFAALPNKPHIKQFAAVGEKTATAIAEHCNISPDEIIFAEKAYQTELLKKFDSIDLCGKTVLSPGPKERTGDMQPFFTDSGAVFERIDTYETVPVLYADRAVDIFIADNKIDVITFFAPSAVHAFFAQAQLPPNVKVAAIGSTTADALKQYSVKAAVPDQQTAASMAQLLIKEK